MNESTCRISGVVPPSIDLRGGRGVRGWLKFMTSNLCDRNKRTLEGTAAPPQAVTIPNQTAAMLNFNHVVQWTPRSPLCPAPSYRVSPLPGLVAVC